MVRKIITGTRGVCCGKVNVSLCTYLFSIEFRPLTNEVATRGATQGSKGEHHVGWREFAAWLEFRSELRLLSQTLGIEIRRVVVIEDLSFGHVKGMLDKVGGVCWLRVTAGRGEEKVPDKRRTAAKKILSVTCSLPRVHQKRELASPKIRIPDESSLKLRNAAQRFAGDRVSHRNRCHSKRISCASGICVVISLLNYVSGVPRVV